VISPEDLDSVEDPLELFRLSSEAISEYQTAIDRLAEIRARAIGALYARGSSYKELANSLGLSTPRVGQLVSANDAAAIEVFNAWAAIEHSLIDLAALASGSSAGPLYPTALQVLRRSNRFDNSAAKDLEYLRQIRNTIVHGRHTVSIEEAERITDKAVYLNALLRVIIFDLQGGSLLATWTDDSHQRLRVLQDDGPDRYETGWWSCAYSLSPADTPLSLPKFRSILKRIKGSETGWPVWLSLDGQTGMGMGIVQDIIECWLWDTDPADFWRADPKGRMFLIRRLQEDYDFRGVQPGTFFDLVLPIWRTGECLLHASRLANALQTETVELEMTWHGLTGRELQAKAGPLLRSVMPGRVSSDSEVRESVTAAADDIRGTLPKLVKTLLSPLYARFDFFEPRDDLYSSELDRLLSSDIPQ
jgi:hypothetical protein